MSTETKWTPGPWSLETVPTSCGVCHKIGPFPSKGIFHTHGYACVYADYASEENPIDRELLANATLIATAPELYEALEDLLGYFRSGNAVDVERATIKANAPEVLAARAALKKARGE